MELAVEGMMMNEQNEGPIPQMWTWWGFYVEALTSGSTVKMAKTGSPPSVTLEYSIDGGETWSSFDVNSGTTITLGKGKRVCFRAGSSGNTRFASSTSAYRRFVFTGSVSVGGNIMSLLSQTEITEFPSNTMYQFAYLFYQATALKDASVLSLPAVKLMSGSYQSMFQNCTSLITAPKISAIKLALNCQSYMFCNCTSLVVAPTLLATTLANYCYTKMFQYCSSLNFIKTNQTSFTGCTDWVQGVASSGTFICPALLGTNATIERGDSACPTNWNVNNQLGFYVKAKEAKATVAMQSGSGQTFEYSIDYGFNWSSFIPGTTTVTLTNVNDIVCIRAGSSGNTSVPTFVFTKNVSVHDKITYLLSQTGPDELPTSSSLANLFNGCTTLIDASELVFPRNVFNGCYQNMFQGCISLVNAPVLPAITLASFCYKSMFSGCTSLVNAPALPATTLASQCYQQMFENCTSLVNAPALPATALMQYCYASMFQGCTSLVIAPTLPATALAIYCYFGMFYNCSSLNFIKTNQTSFTGDGDACYQWVSGVSSSGTFICPASLGTNATIERGVSACPTNWNVNDRWEFYVVANEAGAAVSMAKTGSPSAVTLEYSTDLGSTWSSFDVDGGTTVTLANAGDLVFFRSDSSGNTRFASSASAYRRFVFTGSVSIGGNIMSLLSQTEITEFPSSTTYTYQFAYLFKDATTLQDVLALQLPASTLKNYCYAGMFSNNISIKAAPMLPATSLAQYCYYNMFAGCISLANAPATLSAMTSEKNCYSNMFAGCISLINVPTALPATTLKDYCYYYMFQDCISLANAPALPAMTLPQCCYAEMFMGCISLTTAPALPATTLAYCCYSGMFRDCISLTNAPMLSAINLASHCYDSMFQGCISLTIAPVLPAIALSSYCYENMFQDCTSLATAPALPATVLAEGCYSYMFCNCDSLTTASELPATLLAEDCYSYMFQDCTSLATAPALPATMLAAGCYSYMFYNCASLTTASELPATALALSCYYNMFYNCTSLSTAPILPAITLADYCYEYMFKNCTSLSAVQTILPATTLTLSCYYQMFCNCTSLVNAPILPATTLTTNCYYSMFDGCLNLDFIKTNQTSFTGCGNWVSGVSSSGTFICPASLGTNATIERGVSACPTNWNVCNEQGFYVKAEEAEATVKMAKIGYPPAVTLEYSTDLGSTWSSFDVDGGTTVTLANAGDLVFFRAGSGGNIQFTINYKGEDFRKFVFTGSVSIGGNIMSLLSQTEITEFPSNDTYQFGYLFSNAATLKDASALSLPATVLRSGCYSCMFSGCSSLINAPALPATTLANKCYFYMFEYCYSLANAPSLPATILASECYNGMFNRCTSLEIAPALPAMTLASSCYSYMFSGCTSLATAPVLPATTLIYGCYSYMFRDCTSLTTAPALPATTLVSNCYSYMFSGCTSLATAPVLPATTLINNCYSNMFYNCSNLNFIKTNQTSFTGCTDWVKGVAASGTLICSSSLGTNATIERGDSACPTNWNVSNRWEFYVVANEAGATVSMTKTTGGLAPSVTLEYSTDLGSTWSSFDVNGGTAVTLANAGDLVLFRSGSSGNIRFATRYNGSVFDYRYFIFTKSVSIGGSIMSLMSQTQITEFPYNSSYEAQFAFLFYNATSLKDALALLLPATILTEYCYYHMFQGCISLVNAPENLPATTLRNFCYYYMFQGCTSLVIAPALPATTLADYCYSYMFRNCRSLINAPALPATILKPGCYSYMFQDCISLTNAPALSATTLASSCCYYMFYGCTSLAIAPALPATTLANGCYSYMFRDCISLTAAPALPATTLANGCYYYMFHKCISLTTTPALPATALALSCYQNMFSECRSLINAPILPATALALSCYYSMFYNCTSLSTAPTLPATALANNCYYQMFYGCSSLTAAPALSATTLTSNCYYQMFYNCKNLSYINTNQSSFTGCTNWVYGVSAQGTFDCLSSLTITRGTSACPTNWTVVNHAGPEFTKVKYTAASQLADWEGDISGALVSSSIPNRTSIETLEIGTHVTSLSNQAFYQCSSITDVTIPSSVLSTGTGVFEDCTGLSSVLMYNGISSIGMYAFRYCINLKNLNIPSSVSSINSYAFRCDTSLTSLVIDSTILDMQSFAFLSCTSLSNVTFTSNSLSVSTTGKKAFADCQLANINFPSMTTTQVQNLSTAIAQWFTSGNVISCTCSNGIISLVGTGTGYPEPYQPFSPSL